MSLRDRLQRFQKPAPPSEAAAAQALAGQRGRLPIAPAPSAGKAAAKVLREHAPPGGSLGFSELKRRWGEIVGPPFAGKTAPEKLAGGVLTLRAPSAVTPFLQQQIPLLIERLRLAGAKITTIRVEQRAVGPTKAPNVRPLRRRLTTEEETALAQALDPVTDPGLKSALLRLGRAVKQG